MPRPKKIVQEETKVSEVIEVHEDFVIEPEQEIVEMNFDEEIIESPVVEEISLTVYKVYYLGDYVANVEENSEILNSYLEKNRNQLYDYIDKLKSPTNDQEDLVLFNIPATDNRKYNSLNQYYQQNGLAPQQPRISDWMTYYKIKYPLATEEEIAIQVFGPLDYSFEIAI